MRHYSASVAGCKPLKPLFPMSRRLWCRSLPGAPFRSACLAGGSFPLCDSRRLFSKSTYEWISRLRFGTEAGVFFGAPIDAAGPAAQPTRTLYCRALVHASGGGTRARDWIAGCAALSTADDALLSIALQYLAGAEDVERLRAHLLERLLLQEGEGEGEGEGEKHSGPAPPGSRAGEGEVPSALQTKPVHANPGTTATPTPETEVNTEVSKEQLRKVEHYVLQASPIVRCFLYDAMTASLFKCRGELSIVEKARQRVFDLNAQYFGVSLEDLTAMWRLVEAEYILKEEKSQILGQPWGD